MERTQRVAKLEALLARVQSRSAAGHPGRSSAAAAVSVVPSAAPAARPQLAAVPSPSPSPRPAPVTGGALLAVPSPGAVTTRATDIAAAISDDAPTAIHNVDVAAAMESAAAEAATTKPAAAPGPAPAPAPAFRGVSALGALSKKATLIGTAPPANWPPRGAEPTATEPPKAAAAPEPAPEPAPPAEPAPELQAAEGGDVDALIGGGEETEAPAPRSEPKLVASPMPTPEPVRVSTAPVRADDAEPMEPVIEKPVRKARSSAAVVAFIVLWMVLLAAIWFVYKSSM